MNSGSMVQPCVEGSLVYFTIKETAKKKDVQKKKQKKKLTKKKCNLYVEV